MAINHSETLCTCLATVKHAYPCTVLRKLTNCYHTVTQTYTHTPTRTYDYPGKRSFYSLQLGQCCPGAKTCSSIPLLPCMLVVQMMHTRPPHAQYILHYSWVWISCMYNLPCNKRLGPMLTHQTQAFTYEICSSWQQTYSCRCIFLCQNLSWAAEHTRKHVTWIDLQGGNADGAVAQAPYGLFG